MSWLRACRGARRSRIAGLGILAALAALSAAPTASAVQATGGAGRFGGAIDWVSWGTNNQQLNLSGPVTRQSVSNYAGGHQLVVTCTISNFAQVGGGTPVIRAYRSGNWQGDALDELYNIGGINGANQLVNGLSVSASQVSFDFTCDATLDGNAYPLNGLVFADAEQSGSTEFVQGEISSSATWRLIDRYRTPTCTNDSQVTRTVSGATQTLLLNNPPSALCAAGPAGVAFADGVTSGRITVRGGGTSAVALGAVITFDHGDAPASYGDAAHAVPFAFSGGEPATGTSALFAGNTLASTTQPGLRLGASVDPEGPTFSALADADDNSANGAFGPGDDETDGPPASVTFQRGAPYTLTGLACSGDGALAGWIDFNGNGTYDADERSGNAACSGGTAALTWTVPLGAVRQASSFMRLRYAAASDAAAIASPTGLALTGEAEDHAFALGLTPRADLEITKTPSTAKPTIGHTFTYALRVTNHGPDAADAVTVTDSPGAGVTPTAATASQGSCSAPTSCALGTLASGASATITITARADSVGTAGNTAHVGSSAEDPDPSNNDASATVDVQPSADLSVTKTASDTHVSEGEHFHYTLTVKNAGPSPAKDALVTDSIPAGLSLDSATSSQGSCTQASPVVCALGTINAGATVTVTVNVTATDTGSPENSALVSSSTPDPDPSNNQDHTPVTTDRKADLSITKRASTPVVTIGESFDYIVVVANHGPSRALGTVVTDDLPAGLEVQGASSPLGPCTITGQRVECDLGTLTSGQTVTITITVRTTAEGEKTNGAGVTSQVPDPDPGNNTANTTMQVAASADLAVTKSASASAVPAGSTVVYGISVTDHGPSDAAAATVTDPLPAGAVFVSATPSSGSCSAAAGVVTCALGTIANGATVTVRIEVRLTQAGSTRDSAVVTSPTPDPKPENNVAETQVTSERADLVVTKTAAGARVGVGSTSTYTITVRNAGPSPAHGVVVTDPIPSTLQYLSSSASRGSCSTQQGAVVCAIGDLAPGASATVTVTARLLRAGGAGNSASAIARDPTDPNPANNTAHTVVSASPPQLTLTKTASRRTVTAGGRVTFRLRVRNRTAVTARHVTVCDALPAGLVRVSTRPHARLRAGRWCWTISRLAGHRSATLTIVVRALRGAAGTAVNRATAAGDGTRTATARRAVRIRGVRQRAGGVTG